MSNIHEEHRKRLRELFDGEGKEHINDINLLELMLFYAIPRKDTNAIAHALLKKFRTFDAVLEATSEQLTEVDGIGPGAATYLTMFLPIFKRYSERKCAASFNYEDYDKLRQFMSAAYMNITNEKAMLIHFDAKGQYVNHTWISEGEFDSVQFSNRRIAAAVVENKTVFAVLAHNHPSGICNPSTRDLEASRQVARFLSAINVQLVDSAVVTLDEIRFVSQVPRFYQYIL